MEVRIDRIDKKRIRFVIKGEDYTLGNLIQEALLLNDNVETAGYYITHPLSKEMLFEVRFKKAVEDPIKIIKDSVEKLRMDLIEVRKKLDEVKKEL